MDSHSASASTSSDGAKNLRSTDSGTSTNSQSSSRKYVWSNTKCMLIALEKKFPRGVENLAVQKNIITRFLNFYLGTKVHKQKGVSVTDLVFSVISITPLHPKTEQFMWADGEYHEEGSLFSLALEDKLFLMTENVKANEKHEDEIIQHNEGKIRIAENNDIKKDKNLMGNNNTSEENKPEKQNTVISDTKNDVELPKETKEELKPVRNDTTKHQENVDRFPENEEKAQRNVTLRFPNNVDIVWFSNKLASASAKVESKQYGPVENAAFTASVNKFLELWDSNQVARITLKYFFGFVALTLLRGTTKTFKHLVNAFSNDRFVRYLNFIRAFEIQQLKYSVPHKRCIKCCYRTFRKRDENLRVMFAKVVINSFNIDAKSRAAPGLFPPNIMKVTVLSHTVGYGLGLISMIENLAKREVNLPVLVKLTRCKETESSWEKLITFFAKYMLRATNQRTHFWVRVIDENYFKDLSCAENYPLAVILAVFVDKLGDGSEIGIWQSTWTTKGEKLEHYKEMGLNMYIQYQEAELKELENLWQLLQ